MMKLVVVAFAAMLLQTTSSFAGGLELIKSGDVSPRNMGPSLSSSEIAAVQYHEDTVRDDDALSFRCQTRAGVFNISPRRPVDTSCAVDGLPGFMLP